jgi:hypothetical protein
MDILQSNNKQLFLYRKEQASLAHNGFAHLPKGEVQTKTSI